MSKARLVAAWLVWLVPAMALAQQAPAAPTVVALATGDPGLTDAVRSTLAAWGIAVVVDARDPGATMPGAAERGRALAEDHDAAASVWISSSPEGAALWLYDRSTERVVSRSLPSAPPFDEATASAVALSIKTMLRHSAAAPAGERLEQSAPTRPSVVRLEIAGGVRALGTEPLGVEPRAALAISVWPTEIPGLGVSLAARYGTGVGVDRGAFSGLLSTAEAHLGARGRWAILRELDVTLALSIGAAVSVLDGRLRAGEGSAATIAISDVRVDPTILGEVELGVRPLDRLRIALRIGGLASPSTRSYLVRGESLLETHPLSLLGELVVEIPLDGGRVDSP